MRAQLNDTLKPLFVMEPSEVNCRSSVPSAPERPLSGDGRALPLARSSSFEPAHALMLSWSASVSSLVKTTVVKHVVVEGIRHFSSALFE